MATSCRMAGANPTPNPMAKNADPTNTVTFRREFRVALNAPFRVLKGALRKTVGYANDSLRLSQPNPSALVAAADDIDPAEGFVFQTAKEAVAAFMNWLRRQLTNAVLESMPLRSVRRGEHFTAPFVRSAATRGWQRAAVELRKRGLAVESSGDAVDLSLDEPFEESVPQSILRTGFVRVYRDLQNIVQDLADAIREKVGRALSEEWTPRELADSLSDRVDAIAIWRSTLVANAATVDIFNEAARWRYKKAGVEIVGILNDSPCEEICAPIVRNAPYPIDAIPDDGPNFHPNCKCLIYPLGKIGENYGTRHTSSDARR